MESTKKSNFYYLLVMHTLHIILFTSIATLLTEFMIEKNSKQHITHYLMPISNNTKR